MSYYEAHVEHKGRGKNVTEHVVFDGSDAHMNKTHNVVAFSGYDHSDDPSECMKYLNPFLKGHRSRDMVELTMGDDCYWWAVIEPKVAPKRKK